MEKLKLYLAWFRGLQSRWFAKIAFIVWSVAASYDVLLSQFIPEQFARKLPKAWEVALMTGNLLPWWGWLLILAAILVVSSFEYAICFTRQQKPVPIAGARNGDIEKHVDESMPFLFEKLGDTSALIEHGCLTVAQCALLVPAILSSGKPGDASEMADHFVRLALLDVAHGDLRVKHPQTLLPYSEYLRMARAGMFGPDGEDMPLANAAWLVPLDEAEQWFKSKGFPTDLDGLKAELVKMAAHSESAEDIKLPVIPPCVNAAAQTPDGSKPPTNEQN